MRLISLTFLLLKCGSLQLYLQACQFTVWCFLGWTALFCKLFGFIGSHAFSWTSLFSTDVQRASWENIVNIETPVRRAAVRMVGHVWPRPCWGKPHASVPWGSQAKTASTPPLIPAMHIPPVRMEAPATCSARMTMSASAKLVLQVSDGTEAHTFQLSVYVFIQLLLNLDIWLLRVPQLWYILNIMVRNWNVLDNHF